jgi:hypothetical protein
VAVLPKLSRQSANCVAKRTHSFKLKIAILRLLTVPVDRSVRATAVPHSSWKENNSMATPYQDRKISDPKFNYGDEPFFEAATKGKLLVKFCNDCGQYHHYPRALCPFCFSDKTEWKEATGAGTIYSYSVTRVSDLFPM